MTAATRAGCRVAADFVARVLRGRQARRRLRLVAIWLALAGSWITPDARREPVPSGTWEVVDGDTLRTPSGQRLRLAAIDAPEVGRPGAAEATAFAVEWMHATPNAVVQLTGRDHYGRLLGDLHSSEGSSLGDALVAAGWAWVREPNAATALIDAQRRAVTERLGIHADLPRHWPRALVSTPNRFHTPRCPWVRRRTSALTATDDVVALLQSGRAPCRTCLPWPPVARLGAPSPVVPAAEAPPLSPIATAVETAAQDGDLLKLLALGIVQGLTEFLPVSSSGHLVLGGAWLGMGRADGLLREVALHLGTLVSVLVFCWRDLVSMLRAGSRSLWVMVIASAAVTAPFGLMLEDVIETRFAHPLGAGSGLLLTALLIGVVAPRDDERLKRTLSEGTLRDGLILGLLQSMALIPGVSRAGATITAALLLGFRRPDAVRIAFLMSVPVVAGAVLLKFTEPGALEVVTHPQLLAGMALAAVVGLAALRFISVHCDATSLRRFAVYCLTLGSIAILVAST